MAKIIISDGIIHSDADFELRSGTDTNLRTRFRICNRNDNHTRIKSLSAHDISVASSLCVNNLTVSGTCTVSYCTLTSCTSAVQNNFVVESTDATATAAPDFRLYRSSASPAAGDNLGNITFEGKNSAAEDIVYGQIMACIQCADDGLERSKLVTSVTGGGNFIEVYGVDCNGLWMCANRSLYINGAGSVRNYGNSLCLSTGGGSHDIIFRPNDSTAATIGANCTNTFGNLEFGTWPAQTDYSYIGHKCYDHSSAAYYALLQGCSNGYTYLNGYNRVNIRISNSDKMVLTNTSLCTSVESIFTNCVGVGTTSLGGYKLELADDTDSTVNLLRLRNYDATYSQSWDFQLDTNKDLAITGASGDGGVTITHGSRGTRFCRPSCGYIAVCPSSTWAHFITDRDRYYINKALVVDTGCVTSYDEDLQLRRGSGSATEAVCITNGLTCSNQPVRADGGGAGGCPVLCLVGSCRGSFVWGSSTMYPNLTGGDTAIHLIGKSTGTYNSGYLGFYQVADTCACNFITLGMYSSNHLLNIKGSGEVGIGTTNPADKLVVCGTTNMCKLQLEQGSCRTKIRLYGGTDAYGIGMYSSNCYGGLGATWAMTFQFNDDSSRGFWWGHCNHNVCQGAMSLTTDGDLTLANKLSVGYGESKITGPEYKLDVAEPSGNPPAEPVARICRGNNLAVANQTPDYPELLISGHSSNYKLVIRDQANCELMAVRGNGRVGIGVTEPAELLHIQSAGNAGIAVGSTTTSCTARLRLGTGTAANPTDNGVFLTYEGATSNNFSIANTGRANSSISFHTRQAGGTSATALTIDSDQNVGIGETTPLGKLHVKDGDVVVEQGDLYISSSSNAEGGEGGGGTGKPTLYFGESEGTAAKNFSMGWRYDGDGLSGDNNILYTITNAGSSADGHLSIQYGGNVGIGTTSPAFTNGAGLEIEKSGTATLRLQSAGSNASEIFQSTSAFNIADLSSGTMIFRISNAEKMRLNSTGLGIGNTSPNRLLDLSGATQSWATAPAIQFTSTTNNANVRNWWVGPADTNYGNFHIFPSATCGGNPGSTSEAANGITINYIGKVSIGTTSPDANHNLTIANTANFGIRLTGTNGSICSNTNLIEGAVNNIYLRPSSGYKVYIDSGCGLAVTCGRLDTYSAIGFCYPSNCGPMFESGGTYTNPNVYLKRYDGNTQTTCFGAGHICATICHHAPVFCSTTCIDTCQVNLPSHGMITFYGNNSSNHAIMSRDYGGNCADDIRINSYGAVHVNLDSNDNNTSNAGFNIYRHGGGTGNLTDLLFSVDGEAGTTTICGNLCVSGTIQADGVEGDEYTSATCKLNSITCFNVACSTGLDAIYDIYVSANPNCGGSSLYRDVVHLTAYVTTGWNGSAATKYINTVQHFDRGTVHNSGANAVTACVYLYDGASSTAGESFAAGCDTCLQVQIGGGNTATNAVDRVNECVLIKRVL